MSPHRPISSGGIAAALVLGLAALAPVHAADGTHAPLRAQLTAQHDANVQRLRDWIALPSIAAENLNAAQGAEHMRQLLLEAGFQHADIIPTDGKPGVFATLDAGAPKTVGVYFMYDVKQYDPKEWSSPPLEGRIVHKPGYGQVMMGRGAVSQKGPEAAFLAALHEGGFQRLRFVIGNQRLALLQHHAHANLVRLQPDQRQHGVEQGLCAGRRA